MRIDAHQHYWRLRDRHGAWPPATLTTLHRDRMPEHLVPLLERHRVGKTVLVQSLPTEADTHFMLALASRHTCIGAVVGWTDLKHPDAPARIARLADNPLLRGLRPMLADLADDDWIDDAALAPAIDAMCLHGLSLDALVQPRHLPALLAFAMRFPRLPIVIDHAAKPPVAQGNAAAWLADIERLARLPQVLCKLSGLNTEAGKGWTVAQLEGYVETIITAFGPERVMWGSDWPVVELTSDYASWLSACETLTAGLNEQDRAAIFGGTAARFYRVDADVPDDQYHQQGFVQHQPINPTHHVTP